MSNGRGATFGVRLLPREAAPFEAAAVAFATVGSTVPLTDADGFAWAHEYEVGGRRCVWVRGVATFVHGAAPGEIIVFPVEGATDDAVTEIVGRGVAPLFAHRSGLEVLHASAVEFPTGVVGFCGQPSSGKSTIAYALSERGRLQWSDDALAVDADDVRACVVPLPFSPRLRSPSSALFAGRADAKDGDLARPSEARPLAALFLLDPLRKDRSGPVRMEPVAGSDAFVEMLRSSLFYEDAVGSRRDLTIRHFLALAARIPVVRVAFPSALDQLGTLLDSIERSVPEPAP